MAAEVLHSGENWRMLLGWRIQQFPSCLAKVHKKLSWEADGRIKWVWTFSTGKRVPRNLSPTHYSAGKNSNMSEPLQPFVLIMSLKQCHSVTEASGTWAVKVLKNFSKMDIGWYRDLFTSQLDLKSLLECWSLDFQHESWRMFPTEWMTMMTREVLY